MTRDEILISMFDQAGAGLEIGPGYNPLVPKSGGFNIKSLDYTDQKGLLEKYCSTPNVDVSRIEPVDFVSDGRSMVDIVGPHTKFDYIVASHVIEHTPDMLRFLADCEALLRPDGLLVLAVPDKRYCFDLLQPLSTTGAILQAAIEKRTRPLPGAVFDSVAYDVTRAGAIGWSVQDDSAIEFFSDLHHADHVLGKALASDEYIDVHVWRFVPSSFRLIVGDLYRLGRIGLREARFVPGTGHEFYISLSRSGGGCPISRIELARAALDEHCQLRTSAASPA